MLTPVIAPADVTVTTPSASDVNPDVIGTVLPLDNCAVAVALTVAPIPGGFAVIVIPVIVATPGGAVADPPELPPHETAAAMAGSRQSPSRCRTLMWPMAE